MEFAFLYLSFNLFYILFGSDYIYLLIPGIFCNIFHYAYSMIFKITHLNVLYRKFTLIFEIVYTSDYTVSTYLRTLLFIFCESVKINLNP